MGDQSARIVRETAEHVAIPSTRTSNKIPLRRQVDQVETRIGHSVSASNATVLARTLNREPDLRGTAGAQFVQDLQRKFGNQYVQRVLALARKEASEGEAAPDVEAGIEQSRPSGRPMDSGSRSQMESAFGVDFSGVRIHTGTQPDILNRAVDAVAFTTGRDIFFRDGSYNPDSSSGKELLAHELTHVVQQGGSPVVSDRAERVSVQRKCSECSKEEEDAKQGLQRKMVVGQPDDAYEGEADRVATEVVRLLDGSAAKNGDLSSAHSDRPGNQGAGTVQRKTGDGHDLKSPRFAGDPVLEACFDNERLLQMGSRGPAVAKIQNALIDAGFPLPKFGVDGAFGSETQAALRSFQRAHALTADGIVGPLTMESLDVLFAGQVPPPGPTPPAPTPPAPTPPAPAPPGPAPARPHPAPSACTPGTSTCTPGTSTCTPGTAPAPAPPGPAPAPPGPAPAPPGPAPAPPAATLSSQLQALVTAGKTAYAEYKAKIVAARAAEKATALADTTLLRNIQGKVSRNDFAKVVELLGRTAPGAGTMLSDATVSAAMVAAFGSSNAGVTLPQHTPGEPVGPCNPPAGTPPPARVHEEGGWIYLNLITGLLDTRRATAGAQAAIQLGGPPDVADSVVVGTFHTHPNVGPCWGHVFPSGTDTNSANNTGVPWLIIGAFPDVATRETANTGPGQRLHLAGNRGFPGATGGDAPQAPINGSFDEV